MVVFYCCMLLASFYASCLFFFFPRVCCLAVLAGWTYLMHFKCVIKWVVLNVGHVLRPQEIPWWQPLRSYWTAVLFKVLLYSQHHDDTLHHNALGGCNMTDVKFIDIGSTTENESESFLCNPPQTVAQFLHYCTFCHQSWISVSVRLK